MGPQYLHVVRQVGAFHRSGALYPGLLAKGIREILRFLGDDNPSNNIGQNSGAIEYHKKNPDKPHKSYIDLKEISQPGAYAP